ncbi:unnamed protein product [Cochlearia groenlandica]
MQRRNSISNMPIQTSEMSSSSDNINMLDPSVVDSPSSSMQQQLQQQAGQGRTSLQERRLRFHQLQQQHREFRQQQQQAGQGPVSMQQQLQLQQQQKQAGQGLASMQQRQRKLQHQQSGQGPASMHQQQQLQQQQAGQGLASMQQQELELSQQLQRFQHIQHQQEQILQHQAGQGSDLGSEISYAHMDKKSRVEATQDDMLLRQHQQRLRQQQQQQQQDQQYIMRQDPTGRDPKWQYLLQQRRLRQQEELQVCQSMSPSQRLQLHQKQQQLRHTHVRLFEADMCAQRLRLYLHHVKQRPVENSFAYWKKFVSEFYSPHAKHRLCLSQYNTSAASMWQCQICATKSGYGCEARFDALPRLLDSKYASGIREELLYLDHPEEKKYPDEHMMLTYRRAVQETIHKECRVVREGHLRILFTQELKILTWEFCEWGHEVLLPRRLITSQTNQLLQVAQKCHSTIAESGSVGVSQHDLQSNSNMVLGAGRKLAEFMELPMLNDLAYPKSYIRTFQMGEVTNSMKDLMDITYERNIGPIEGLKLLSEQMPTLNHQRQKTQEVEQMGGSAAAAINGLDQAAAATASDQSILVRQNGMNSPTPCQNPTVNSNGSHSLSPHQLQTFVNSLPNMKQQNHPNHLESPRPRDSQMREMNERENRSNVRRQLSFSGLGGSNGNAERNTTAFTPNISGQGGSNGNAERNT